MTNEAHTLGFGVTYHMVAARTACGHLLTLTSHNRDDEVPPHKHINDYICIVLSGSFAEHQGKSWRERLGGCFFTHHAGETHHDQFGARGAMCLNLHFDPARSAPLLDGMCSASAKVAADRLAFELATGSHEDLVMASLAAEIMGALQPVGYRGRDDGNWIARIVYAITDQPHRRWSLMELAAIAERHPVHVAQSFRAKMGISLGAFQRLRRLTSLSLALRRGRGPLATLAARHGYCDQAHMTCEFRAAFGVSPGRYRRDFH